MTGTTTFGQRIGAAIGRLGRGPGMEAGDAQRRARRLEQAEIIVGTQGQRSSRVW